MKKIIVISTSILIFVVFQFNIMNDNRFNTETFEHINKSINGQAFIDCGLKESIMDVCTLLAGRLKNLYSNNPPKMIFENNIILLIVSYIIYNTLNVNIQGNIRNFTNHVDLIKS